MWWWVVSGVLARLFVLTVIMLFIQGATKSRDE